MQVEDKKGKCTFNTLDSTIIDSQRNSTGYRVEGANNEMTVTMGVSKAIINNVIFCHQEDSNWPLEEGKKLKEKFDSIFGTTEYNKAIDKMIKSSKEYNEELKFQTKEKEFLLVSKNDATQKSVDLDRHNTKHKEMNLQLEEIDKALEPIDKEIENILRKEKQFTELHSKRAQLESR